MCRGREPRGCTPTCVGPAPRGPRPRAWHLAVYIGVCAANATLARQFVAVEVCADCRLPITDCRLPIADCRYRTPSRTLRSHWGGETNQIIIYTFTDKGPFVCFSYVLKFKIACQPWRRKYFWTLICGKRFCFSELDEGTSASTLCCIVV